METKSLSNTNIEDVKKTTSDLKVTGNGDLFQLIAKASSAQQGWMKSTKAMQIPGIGCVVQVTTEFRNKEGQVTACAEALTFVPGVTIREQGAENNKQKYLAQYPSPR